MSRYHIPTTITSSRTSIDHEDGKLELDLWVQVLLGISMVEVKGALMQEQGGLIEVRQCGQKARLGRHGSDMWRTYSNGHRDGRGGCINMWAVGAQVHFSWLPRLRFFPLFESSPRRLRTYRICNRFRIIMLDSYRRRHPTRPFRVVTLVSYRPIWIIAVSPVSCRHTRRRLTHFGSSPSHPFWIAAISPISCRHVSPILDCHPSLANKMGYTEALI